jgi:hypothetical protein
MLGLRGDERRNGSERRNGERNTYDRRLASRRTLRSMLFGVFAVVAPHSTATSELPVLRTSAALVSVSEQFRPLTATRRR